MCFSNLPIEFDEAGNPYLAEEADEVEHVADCGCGTTASIDEDDPEAAFEAVVSSVPESVREDILGRDGGPGDGAPDDAGPDDAGPDDRPTDQRKSESAEGD